MSLSADAPPPALHPGAGPTRLQWALLAAVAVAALAAFGPGLRFMAASWQAVPEYSHGVMVPLVSAFLVWQQSDVLRRMKLSGAWSGLWLVAAALAMGVLGELSAVRVISQYGFVVAVFGVAVCSIGWRGTRVLAVPLGFLFFMVPLPQFVLREMSQQLQLWSSQIGVGLIRAFGISVFLEGNVIDLGSYKLQVADACSGLRYLFPLVVLGCLAARFFDAAPWKRVLLVAATVPLTIITNSLRIGLIGVTVEHWGPQMAEGLLHDFEGWFVFMICLLLLAGLMSLLARMGGATLASSLVVNLPAPRSPGAPGPWTPGKPWPLLAAGAVLAATAAWLVTAPGRAAPVPERLMLDRFPLELAGGFSGRAQALDREIVATLAVDDYLLADFQRAGEPAVNFYVAYYASQGGGQSTHSPRTCLPGDGWRIAELTQAAVGVSRTHPIEAALPALVVNRAVIQKGSSRQLVYYWFQQRGRSLTDELEVKWTILRDGLLLGRSDGALVRLVTAVAPGESMATADARLQALLAEVQKELPAHVPD